MCAHIMSCSTKFYWFCIFFCFGVVANHAINSSNTSHAEDSVVRNKRPHAAKTAHRLHRLKTTRMATICETPNHDAAYCIPVKQCPKLLRQINNTEAWPFLRASHCGPNNENRRNPKVCCGKYNNYLEIINKQRAENGILPKKCGVQRFMMAGRITGGTEASLGEFPWMARLIHKNKYGYKTYGCSGFLIHSKYVMTAAHCVRNNSVAGTAFSVSLGEHDVDSKIDCFGTFCADAPQVIRISKIIAHPKYIPDSNSQFHDIALLYLKKGARMTDFVQPICLQTDPNQVPYVYSLSGWGKTDENHYMSKIKMKVEVRAFDKIECAEKYYLLNTPLIDSQICAGGEKLKDSCTGDSGGPLMMTTNGTVWYASGIVSYGVGCGVEGWPSVYTSIPKYMDWVKQQITANSLVPTKTNLNKT